MHIAGPSTHQHSADRILGFNKALEEAHLRPDVRLVVEGDFEAGIKLHAANVLASKDVTVMEADLENPPDDPFHCPPATSMVCFYRDGRVHHMRQYYAPRPEGQHDHL